MGRDSSVSIVTGYGLDGPGIECRWGARFSPPVQTDPAAHATFCAVATGSFPGVRSGRGVTLTLHRRLVPWSRKSRYIPLLPVWALRPVQSLGACTRVHFDFTFTHYFQALLKMKLQYGSRVQSSVLSFYDSYLAIFIIQVLRNLYAFVVSSWFLEVPTFKILNNVSNFDENYCGHYAIEDIQTL